MKSVADLRPGESGKIIGFTDEIMSLKLLEMGCLPGTHVTLNFIAPLGDPVSVFVSGYNLSLRLNEAASIIIE